MKKMIAMLLALCLCVSVFAGCSSQKTDGEPTAAQVEKTPEAETVTAVAETVSAPKYVFLFIGDGMSYPQIQSTSDFLGALNDEDYFLAQPSLDQSNLDQSSLAQQRA